MNDQAKVTLAPPPQSPFLPGTNIQFAFDSTSIGMFKTCPRLYYYTMIEGWAPKHESVHLRFGIEYHTALQEYDVSRANGVRHEDAIHDVVRALVERTADWNVDATIKAGKYKNRNTIVSLVIDYLDHFGADDPAKTYLLADGRPAVELSFRFELEQGPGGSYIPEPDIKAAILAEGGTPNQPYILCGHLDRVVEFNSQLLVMDRKTTTTTLSDSYFDQYEPNNQMTLYTLAGQVILGQPVRGVIIDAAQVLLEKPNRFVRGFTYRTPDQLEEWMTDLAILLNSAEDCATGDYWPQNDTACDKFGGCRFRGICSKSPQVREKFLASDFTKLEPDARWNPLKPR